MDIDALYAAAIAGDADAISELAKEADKVDSNGKTILHNEAKNGNTARVRFIVSNFASKNLLVKVNTFNQSALLLAASCGHTEVVKVLIDAARQLSLPSFQAFLRKVDNSLNTTLHYPVRNGAVG